jgi:copper chaperone CopZ
MRTTAVIPTMRSEYCKQAVFTALTPLEGIVRVEIEATANGGSLVIEHDGRIGADALRAVVAVAGYDVTDVSEDRRTLTLVGDSETPVGPYGAERNAEQHAERGR